MRIFLLENGDDTSQFYDENWLLDLCFLVDITSKLNSLNQEMQGEQKIITDYYQSIKSFIAKLGHWIRQLSAGNASHFPHVNQFEFQLPSKKDVKRYSNLLQQLLDEFNSRFHFLEKFENDFKLFLTPFAVNVDEVADELQMELIDLQSSLELRSEFKSCDKLDFYRKFVTYEKYPNLRKFAIKLVSIFGTTYRNESMFSRMKRIKSKDRNQLTDKHLTDQLCVATTNLEIDFNKLANSIENQAAH